jgi:AAA family ATP:ADP antiporter
MKFIIFAILSVFCVCGEYAITRPTSNALFLTLFSVKAYPWVWLATVPLNLCVIYLYNRFLSKIGPLRMLCSLAFVTILMNFLAGSLYSSWPQFIFIQYMWKDIYVLLMLKQIWSMIHSTIPSGKAKYLYGFIYGMGTVGTISGSMIPGFFAPVFGSEKILFFTLPIYLLLMLSYSVALKHSKVNQESFEKDLTADPRAREAISLIRRSPVLLAVISLVIFMQISTALLEYQFNTHLEMNIFDKDLRTAYCGKIGAVISCMSLALQFLGGFLMIRTLGLRGSHFLIPVLLGSSALISLAMPSFAIISCSYIFLKAIDFSLFGVVREMLYAPLQLDAKYRAKAIIDVFAYRTSKAAVSVALLLMNAIGSGYLLRAAGWASVVVFICWLGTVALFFRKRELLVVE